MPKHAVDRMRRRKIRPEEIVDALENPARRVELEEIPGQYRKRVNILGKNKLTVVLGLPNFIITVFRKNLAYAESRRKERANDVRKKNRNIYKGRPSSKKKLKL